jgi:transcriptional regulator with XRE-family HTH domain
MTDKDIIATVAANVRESRKVAGLSQEELALEAEVDRTYISQVERGKRNITIVVLARLARAMGTTASSLLTECKEAAHSLKRRSRKVGFVDAINPYWALPCIASTYFRWWGDWNVLTSFL